ncbi:MAG TPA: sulfite exporter TauE/SafE family protein [Dongiaceae bacterium]
MSLKLRFFLAALALLIVAAIWAPMRAQADDGANPFGVGAGSNDQSAAPGDSSDQAPAAKPSLLRRVGTQVIMLESRINRTINAQLIEIKDGGHPWALWGGLVIGLLYGIFHALGPGHGKTVIVGYFLGHHARPWRGVVMASWISISHVIGAIVIVFVVHTILSRSLASPVDEVDGLRVFSYAAILLIGLFMLYSALRGGHSHAHAHGHEGHDHGHVHGPACAHVPGAGRQQGILGIAAGFIPCSGATLILVFALTNGIILSGIAMTLAIAVGMAMTLSVMGVTSILVRRQLEVRLPERTLTTRAFSLAGPILVTLIGAVLLSGSLLLPATY